MEVTDLTPFDASRDTVEVTNHRSPNFAIEKIPALIDFGTASFEVNLDWESPLMDTLYQDFQTAGNAPWRITLPTATGSRSMTFLASLSRYSTTAPVKDVMKASFELSISGAPEFEELTP
jgi:hypothetical protein